MNHTQACKLKVGDKVWWTPINHPPRRSTITDVFTEWGEIAVALKCSDRSTVDEVYPEQLSLTKKGALKLYRVYLGEDVRALKEEVRYRRENLKADERDLAQAQKKLAQVDARIAKEKNK